ncbi:hypothetical protein PILCRDRAFT_3446 [Piloderma croceum F 1598]|uniref:Uncharacterized protein n=1 Tax=Piloderma croceum (strain F 1598) TaxID=765440 RepID=A0A0C3FVH2_PILCF|nr:hypothetical protein PILCRDRAFT_3446 [Piloderma croceum F 1598]
MESISADEEPLTSGRPTLEKFAAYWRSPALKRQLKRVEKGKIDLEGVTYRTMAVAIRERVGSLCLHRPSRSASAVDSHPHSKDDITVIGTVNPPPVTLTCFRTDPVSDHLAPVEHVTLSRWSTTPEIHLPRHSGDKWET